MTAIRQSTAARTQTAGAYCGGRAGGALVGCGFFGRRSRASGRRMDRCCQAAAALVQRGSQHDQRPGGRWCCRPVGDDARAAGGGRLRCCNGPGAQAGRRARTAHSDRWRYGRRAGHGEPRACGERFSGACVLGDDRLHSPDSLAARRPEAWIFGAGRIAAGCFGRCCRGAARPACVVRCGADDAGRTGRPSRAGPDRGAGRMAPGGRPDLLAERVFRPAAPVGPAR